VVVSRAAKPVPEELAGKVKFFPLSSPDSKPLRSCEAVRQLKVIFQDHQPRVSIAGPLWPCAYEAAAITESRIVAISWAFDVLIDARRSKMIQAAIRRALSTAALTIFDSRWVYKEAQKIVPLQPSATKVFPWGVDSNLFRPVKHKTPGHETCIDIIHTRYLDRIYNPTIVLKAFHLASRRTPNLRLNIIAHGPQLDSLKTGSIRMGLQHKIRWLSPLANEQLPALLRRMSLYTSASCSDGASISLLEAMACGLPVVVPNLPSNIGVLPKGSSSQLFALNDPVALANKWHALASLDSAKRAQLGQANRDRILKIARKNTFEKRFREAIVSSMER
jgi:glycosyltransferase involved in cell wall biosynthesis